MSHRDAHLNLVTSSRQLFEFDPGADIEAGDGFLLASGRSAHPAISNAAFRTDDGLDASELIDRAKSFFAARNRGFAVWARTGGVDDDLIEAAEEAGLRAVHEMPEMVLGERAEAKEPATSAAVDLGRVASGADAEDFWRVAAKAYASNGFPPEVFAYYEQHTGFDADNLAAFLARLDGEPAAIAMTIVSHGVGGIYWVGCIEAARRHGLGRAMTARAVNAGFEMGAEIASLQASQMGEPIYRRMGFEALHRYRLLLAMPPNA